jgi:hypothetical protein
MFLLRMAFWLSIVVALIPVNPEDLSAGQRPVTTFETLGAAQAVVSDLAGFCERNVNACATGREVFAQFGAKARTGLRYVAAWVEKDGEATDVQPDTLATGAIASETVTR